MLKLSCINEYTLANVKVNFICLAVVFMAITIKISLNIMDEFLIS